MKKGIYIIRFKRKAKGKHLYKIGVSRNIHIRLQQLPKHELIHTKQLHDPYGAETYIHSLFKTKRVTLKLNNDSKLTECFFLTEDDINECIFRLQLIHDEKIKPRSQNPFTLF